MPFLFNLPRVTSTPGAKLYFYRTNTTTPQAVYTDEALDVAHSQPVTADASGLFAPIYLDPTLPAYRVRLTTAADVLAYQTDDVPSNQNTSTSQRVESTAPSIILYDTDGTVNQRKFRIQVSGGLFAIALLNDAESSANNLLSIETGVFPRLVLSTDTTVDDGLNEYSLVRDEADSYTGTLTGMASDPTSAVLYALHGSQVTLYIPSASDGFTGTSDATSMTITGMPADLWPQRTQTLPIASLIDSGNYIGDGENVSASISTAGVITFLINGSATGFTASGTKSTGPGCTITYLRS